MQRYQKCCTYATLFKKNVVFAQRSTPPVGLSDFPWNWLTDLGWLNWIGLHCLPHIPNLVYTVTVWVYTLSHIPLFLSTAALVWLTPCFSLLGDNPEWLFFWRCKGTHFFSIGRQNTCGYNLQLLLLSCFSTVEGRGRWSGCKLQ